MIYTVTMYAGKCDCCGHKIELGGGQYSAYAETDGVEEEMSESGWFMGNGKEAHLGEHYCPDCWYWDDDDIFRIKESRRNLALAEYNNTEIKKV